ncbi:MAG: hypothetical protein J2P48_08550 [Alphaproteobacteria bacterium]|nr:hypothetical protein [Alphaproteobacteria bacterium]
MLARPEAYGGEGGTVRLDIAIEGGRIAGLRPTGSGAAGLEVDLDGGMMWPCIADIHAHLGRGHV